MKLEKNTRIGVWGYGLVGKAITDYFRAYNYYVNVMDQRPLSNEEKNDLKKNSINFYHEDEKNNFFNVSDYIISSPGVNISDHYQTYKHKWLTELDLFQRFFSAPIIAITGSIGKTSTMHLMQSLLSANNKRVAFGGNIGTPTFDLIALNNSVDYALLETSSFQLQYCTTFAPTLAIITNIHPNHLDHHKTYKEYCDAKYTLIKYQSSFDNSLVPLSMRDKIPTPADKHTHSYFTVQKPCNELLAQCAYNERIYFIENNNVMRYSDNSITTVIALDNALRSFSFIENILVACAASDILFFDSNALYLLPTLTQLPEHRLEKVATINTIEFYNDSKSTTTVSTLSALEKLKNKPIYLFLGGLSKGVDRSSFIAQLPRNVKFIYCFGKEAKQLQSYCSNKNIPAQSFANLNDAFTHCINNVQSHAIILLSPAGSSYDLYKDYAERGAHFKSLITAYQHRL
jgi:UDP-N-acetylmuramoylalanine--D-glutamate ligase